MSSEPTARQRQLLTFVEWHRGAKGYPPTRREIMKHLGMASTNGVTEMLHSLARKGLVMWEPNRARSLVTL